MHSLLRAQIQSLVSKLRSCKPLGIAARGGRGWRQGELINKPKKMTWSGLITVEKERSVKILDLC